MSRPRTDTFAHRPYRPRNPTPGNVFASDDPCILILHVTLHCRAPSMAGSTKTQCKRNPPEANVAGFPVLFTDDVIAGEEKSELRAPPLCRCPLIQPTICHVTYCSKAQPASFSDTFFCYHSNLACFIALAKHQQILFINSLTDTIVNSNNTRKADTGRLHCP